MADSRLRILMEARNRASRTIKQVGGDLDRLDKAAGAAAGGLRGLAAIGGVAGVAALGGIAFSMAETAAQGQRLRRSFDQLAQTAGESGDEMLSAMRSASRGMVSDSDLILSANRAMLLGVADSGEELSGLLEVAAARGQAMGLSLTQAFQDIVTGIGRMSPLILDNLGITIDQAAANEEYASTLGKTANALTDAEKKQALLNAVLRESAGLVEANRMAGDDAATTFERFSTSLANVRGRLGELVLPGVTRTLEAISSGLQLFSGNEADRIDTYRSRVQGLEAEIKRLEGRYQGASAAGKVWIGFLLEAAQSSLELQQATLQQELQAQHAAQTARLLSGDFFDVAIAAERAAAGMDAAGVAAVDTRAVMNELSFSLDAAQEAFTALMGIQRRYQAQTAQIGSQLVDEMGPQGALGWIQDQNSAISQQISLWRDQGFNIDEINSVLLPNYISQLQDVGSELNTSAQRTRGLSDAAREAERAFDRVRSTAQSVLSGALGVTGDVGINLDDFLPRQDAINEDARRLADIAVRGWESPWVDYFRTNFPALWAEAFRGAMDGGDVQAQAAQLLREFESGLRPELLDKEAAKERVRQMLLGEQNLSELAGEIAAELAEEMGGFSAAGIRSTVNRALGLRAGDIGTAFEGNLFDFQGEDRAGGLATGTAFLEGALEGVSNTGAQIVATVSTQLKLESNLALIREAGSINGASFANGFIEFFGGNVPAAVISVLADLVTPVVEDRISVQGSLQGAQ